MSWSPKPCGTARDDPDGDGDTVPYPGIYARVSENAALEWINGCFKDTERCGTPYLGIPPTNITYDYL